MKGVTGRRGKLQHHLELLRSPRFRAVGAKLNKKDNKNGPQTNRVVAGRRGKEPLGGQKTRQIGNAYEQTGCNPPKSNNEKTPKKMQKATTTQTTRTQSPPTFTLDENRHPLSHRWKHRCKQTGTGRGLRPKLRHFKKGQTRFSGVLAESDRQTGPFQAAEKDPLLGRR